MHCSSEYLVVFSSFLRRNLYTITILLQLELQRNFVSKEDPYHVCQSVLNFFIEILENKCLFQILG